MGKTDEQSTCARHDARRFREIRFGMGFELGCCVLVGPLTVDSLSMVGPKIMVLEQKLEEIRIDK